MIHPDTELQFISSDIGYGVVATKLIPAGTITWVLDKLDREFTPRQFYAFEPLYQEILDTYTYRNNKGNYVLCWDIGRYVNHSFKSTCLTTAYDFEVAIRDILPGEQLTDDYGYLNIVSPFKAADEGTRRKIVYPDDLLKYYQVWDRKIEKVFPKIPELHQPLRPLLSEKTWNRVVKITSEKGKPESILANFYEANNK